MDMILPATLSSHIHTHTIYTYTTHQTNIMFTAFFFSLPESIMDYLLDEDIEMEFLSAIAF